MTSSMSLTSLTLISGSVPYWTAMSVSSTSSTLTSVCFLIVLYECFLSFAALLADELVALRRR